MQLLHGDCLELMKNIPDGSVDMVLCDLPYGIADCKWDRAIDLVKLWEQYERIVKENGVFCMFGQEPFSTKLRMSNLEHFKYDWIWIKNTSTGFQHAKNMPMRKHEIISVFSYAPMGHVSILGDRRMKYFPQGLKECKRVRNATKKFGGVYGKRPSHKDVIVQTETGYPNSILYYPSVNHSDAFHSTQKPVELLECLIKTYTNEGEIVLDNCMGSGSTGVACVNTGRDFIGIELDEHYFEVAKNRIQQAQTALPEGGFSLG